MGGEESHMAVGYKWLYCSGKLITLSFDIYEPAGVQMFSCWCFKKPAESIKKTFERQNTHLGSSVKIQRRYTLKGLRKKVGASAKTETHIRLK